MATKASDIESLSKKLTEYLSSIVDLNSKVKKLETDKAELEKQIASKDHEIQVLHQKIKALEKKTDQNNNT